MDSVLLKKHCYFKGSGEQQSDLWFESCKTGLRCIYVDIKKAYEKGEWKAYEQGSVVVPLRLYY